MAQQDGLTPTGTNTFDKSQQKNISDFHEPKNSWSYARNAINNSVTGDLGDLGNEPANKFCTNAPYTIIGAIHLFADYWAIMSTDNTNSEIGLFQEDRCTYQTIVNDPCLNFKQTNLITGASKKDAYCSYNIYWQDGLNPDRAMCIGDPNEWATVTPPFWPCVPFKCREVIISGSEENPCTVCDPDPALGLDCDAIRLATLINPPCVRVERGAVGGELQNGSYFVVIAYLINGEKIGDYSMPSNVVPLFQHQNVASSLDIYIEEIDDVHFSEYELILVSSINQQTVARSVGTYSINQRKITLDAIDARWEAVEIGTIITKNPIVDKSDMMVDNGIYLMRAGTYDKFDFNYQPLANQIITNWQSVEYPADYYRKGGYQVGYMRDEVYSFFIRWVYNTGDRSSSYNIPGRPARLFNANGLTLLESDDYNVVNCASNIEFFQTNGAEFGKVFEVFNTATLLTTYTPGTNVLPDGGWVISEGDMGYWESTEKYPNNPAMWNSNTGNPGFDLCGQPIRHHKFPDNALHPTTVHYRNGGKYIRTMGVKFRNISTPVDNNGNPITNIIGYEILRGTREGNRSVIAKGMINRFGQYELEANDSATNPNSNVTPFVRKGLYPNYPYNDVPRGGRANNYYGYSGDTYLADNHSRFNRNSCKPDFDNGGNLIANFPTDLYTFHSPETQFKYPFLSMKEMKIYGELQCDAAFSDSGVDGQFVTPEEHPEHKLLTDSAFYIAFISGIGLALLAANGPRRTSRVGVTPLGIGFGGTTGTYFAPAPIAPNITGFGALGSYNTILGTANATWFNGGVALASTLAGLGNSPLYSYIQTLATAAGLTSIPGTTGGNTNVEQDDGELSQSPLTLKALAGSPTFMYYASNGTNTILEFIKTFSRYKQYAMTYRSHAFYNYFAGTPGACSSRWAIQFMEYLQPHIQDFGDTYRINNLYRQKAVALQINQYGFSFPETQLIDNSKITITDAVQYNYLTVDSDFFGVEKFELENVTKPFRGSSAASFYTGLKQRLRNQYGQVDNIVQVPTNSCVYKTVPGVNSYVSPTLFGGDTYVSRYTEKNTMPFFYDWLYGQEDGFEYNYDIKRNVPYPVYWANMQQGDMFDFIRSVVTQFIGSFQLFPPAVTGNPFSPAGWDTPGQRYCLDGTRCINNATGIVNTFATSFVAKNSYFYLFNSGVRDFFVESEINTEFRDWGEEDFERHYDPYTYTDLNRLFDVEIIRSTNFYKYDISLSISKLFSNFVTWGEVQDKGYDPLLSESCYVYRPNRIIYSMSAEEEEFADFWRIFLPENYKDYTSRPTSIKTINKNGIVIFFETESPIQYQGVDTLETDLGTKITIGDGGLFSQPRQAVNNVDAPYEYASCQDFRSVINTPAGLFWISANQGKIFTMGGSGANEISSQDMKWWFANYLPFKLLEDFPDFELTDNPVIGIGTQSIYNNQDSILYFMKKDYKLKDGVTQTIRYLGDNRFIADDRYEFLLGDVRYFEDASWTISFDPKVRGWISFHDWHPELCLPGKKTFMTTMTTANKQGGIWIHNRRADLYCNYYGIDRPFELEFTARSGQSVQTLRSVEYIMEVYKYSPNQNDRFHVLDFNFDEATVYNTEQVSGLLKLDLNPKNNPVKMVNYPIVNFSDIRILYSKEENKYRFDQFFDITDDRGEFTNAQRMIWLTPPNGYAKVLNPANMNYQKNPFQRKKFRHYEVSILLRRRVCGDKKMLVMIQNVKNQYSLR